MLLKNIKIQSNLKQFLKAGFFLSALFVTNMAFADEVQNLGNVAKNITNSFAGLAQLFLAVAYIAGLGFAVASIFKFKQHKDAPTQVPLGTPIALLAIAVSLIFIGYFIEPLGKTLGAEKTQAGGTGGQGAVKLPGWDTSKL